MNALCKVIAFSALVCSFGGQAFEKEKLVFSDPSDKSKAITFEFYGKKFQPVLSIAPSSLAKGVEVNDELVQQILNYFKKSYQYGLLGDRNKTLELWLASDRQAVNQRLNDKFFEIVASRYKKITHMALTKIIKYGEYYLCYVMTEFESKPGGFNVPSIHVSVLKKEKGGFFKTEQLSNNYFVNVISSSIDPVSLEAYREKVKLFPED